MQKSTLTRALLLALRVSTVLALVAAPYQISFGSLGKIQLASAYAKSGSGGGGSGGGGEGHGGNSGSGSDGDHSGNSGPGGGDDGAGHDAGDDNDHHGQEHVNAAGDKVEISDDKTEVIHPDGTREEIENGRLEVKDASGRTTIERAATPEDIARLQSL